MADGTWITCPGCGCVIAAPEPHARPGVCAGGVTEPLTTPLAPPEPEVPDIPPPPIPNPLPGPGGPLRPHEGDA